MAKDSLGAYIATIDRIEPDVAMIDAGAYYASAAISLKRIADALEKLAAQPETLKKAISEGIDSGFAQGICMWKTK